MVEIVNEAAITGLYNGVSTLAMETALTIQNVNVTFEKTADHAYWGSGPLTYTLTITNNETVPYNGITLTDTLDISKVAFVEDSVLIDGAAPVNPSDVDYDPDTGELTVTLGDLAGGGVKTVSFQVNKV